MACDPDAKCDAAAGLYQDWREGRLVLEDAAEPAQTIVTPGRPELPRLVSPLEVKHRGLGSTQGRAALVHALAHIEFNAINLALDAAYRFRDMPADFYGEWLKVAAEEACHFTLLRDHLRESGHDYGDFTAHNGLWDMALKTAHDPLARMGLVPRLLEARGLDVTPGIRAKLYSAGDHRAAAILDIILADEVGHVGIGNRWFEFLCQQRGLSPTPAFAALLEAHDTPRPRPPFNRQAREAAGFSAEEMLWLEQGG
ncbi:hypothetical protein GALL_458110 [mine drainage metagenome]|uniref:Protein containing DUF455 n=1 Tax=mine drainage metagenome TaxID=410659 RepID=A0A1J5Q532_9ZZZZ